MAHDVVNPVAMAKVSRQVEQRGILARRWCRPWGVDDFDAGCVGVAGMTVGTGKGDATGVIGYAVVVDGSDDSPVAVDDVVRTDVVVLKLL